jgi:AraC family transcriptional regulator
MLRQGEARVLDVAIACGFKTQQHFARVFRRMCGASPGEYRQTLWAKVRFVWQTSNANTFARS